jgi:ATP-dependent Clp protease protease subunit|tara:strand:+ start:544 stop:1161 length:618 start_codon:yes stop_codon:yes gene_type:complete
MGLYEEKFKEAAENLDPVTDIESKSSTAKWEESDRGVWIPEGVIYLVGELADYSLFDFMTRVRTVIRERDEKDADLNLIINSPGGDVSEMFGIIDFMELLDVKINTVCRGAAQSAAAIILACGTGQRAASKYSTIMFHQGSTFSQGKLSDVRAGLEYSKSIESKIYSLLGEKTKKPAGWWEDKMKSDFYISAEEALELGVIDTIG